VEREESGVESGARSAERSGARAAGLEARAGTARRAGKTAAATAGVLALGKLVAGLLGNSTAVTASAVDSLMDVFASSANTLAIRLSHAAPDREHPFGHAKFEAVATAAQGLLIGGSGIYLLIEGSRRLIKPQPLRLAAVTLGAMAASTLVTVALVVYLRAAAKKSGSRAIKADSLHYETDIAANLAVLVGVGMTYATGIERIDGGLTVLVALYVLSSALGLLRSGVGDLVDQSASAEQIQAIEGVLGAMRERGEILGYHRLRTRVAGRTTFVEAHVELPLDMMLSEAHAVSNRVSSAIVEVLTDAEVLIHIDVDKDEPDS
jgi:ferrous-iron efflux pump FieF